MLKSNDLDAIADKINDNEWLALASSGKNLVQLSGIDIIIAKIEAKIKCLSRLNFQYPNNSRFRELGSRAVKCYDKESTIAKPEKRANEAKIVAAIIVIFILSVWIAYNAGNTASESEKLEIKTYKRVLYT